MLPILDIIKTGIKIVNKIAGTAGKGKMTNAGLITAAVGTVATLVNHQNPFDSARMILDLAEKSWPHATILAGALTTFAGYFRAQGAAHAPTNNMENKAN